MTYKRLLRDRLDEPPACVSRCWATKRERTVDCCRDGGTEAPGANFS